MTNFEDELLGLAKQLNANRVKAIPKLQAISCGHVHRASEMLSPKCLLSAEINNITGKGAIVEQCVDVYTCPATSIQFDPQASSVQALDKGPGYRLFHLATNGALSSEVIWC